LIFISFSITETYGQKCRWETEKVDAFTDQLILESKPIHQGKVVIKGNEPRSIGLQLIRKSDKYLLKSYTRLGYLLDEEITNPVFRIKISDGSILTYKPQNVSSMITNSGINGVTLIFEINVDKADLTKISKYGPVAFQTSFNAVEATFELSKKVKKNIANYAVCILNYE
jgi:hypothetical protein